ncbi:MAG: hydantoinase B/oxoprolinase family protein [Alphaproteobacteria bacterium]|nr:hydantoinase B/oxoprolinase family protein [Alphaproteobacteria bacterium]
MPAKIIQTNNTPFRKIDLDPITLDIVENALRNARDEMDAVLFRTAMSPGIREQHDAFPMIANQDGKMVVGQFGSFFHGFQAGYHGTIEEGDVFLTNDPYSCNGAVSHLNDWLTMMPIYIDGRIVAWGAMFGHMTDIGGKVPGSLPTDAAQLFEEGVQVPPVKIYRKGVLNEEILELILRNCRLPEWNRSDFNAIIAALRMAERRVVENCKRFGVDEFVTAMDEMLDRNKRAMGTILKQVVPEEKQYFEDYIDDDGVGMGPYKIACSLWREGDRVVFDFEGTDPQSISSVNFLLNEEMFKMFLGAFFINIFDPQILFNDGFYDLVDVRIPKGTILKPIRPAALSCRTHLLGRIFDIMSGLLGQSSPDALCAAGFSDSPHFMYSGYDKKGEWYQLYQIGFGGIPGRPAGDGADGHSLWPAFTNVPNEFLEAYFPLRIMTYETIADSGGAGLHRGGNGLSIGYQFLEPGNISIHDDRWLSHPWGVNGGRPGARSTKLMVRADGSEEWMESKCDRIQVNPGDTLYFNTWGGGGWGDPLQRDPALVALDTKRGLVTAEGAKRYGVILGADGSVDQRGSDDLRRRMDADRGKIELFDRGGTIEELKARCKADTTFEPPRNPVFQKWMGRQDKPQKLAEAAE